MKSDPYASLRCPRCGTYCGTYHLDACPPKKKKRPKPKQLELFHPADIRAAKK